ncbi:MAG: cupin domain-containing protein [Calditrichales bacterium]|nr:MAG: cupin domain-containing protein [Calditrichales bacterium]
MNVQKLIDRYKLIPHPEGGYYREVYRSEQILLSPAAGIKRNALTHIYFLLAKGQVSRFHKVVHDEVWNFYRGSPLKLIQYNGKDVTEAIIGVPGNDFVTVVKGGIFQAAETTGAYSLVGCTVAPGFEFEDFSFLSDDPELKAEFLKKYPDYQRLV